MANDLEAPAIPPAGGVAPAERATADAGRRRLADEQPNKRRPVVDMASVLGSSLDNLPPEVHAALASLVELLERLREELELSHRHESFLAGEADRYPMLPVLNRRAFLRALGRIVESSERAGMSGSLVYLHIDGIDMLRSRHGLAASDAALTAVAEALRAQLRQTDLVGYIDCGDFLVALALAADADADEKVRELVGTVERPFEWSGCRYMFAVAVGVARFRSGTTVEELLTIADAARRGCGEGSASRQVD
jgi:diguanylate cyclase (GGDEF)-like protein